MLDYSPPSITAFSAERCSSDGSAAQLDGTNVRYSFAGKVTALNNKNGLSCVVYYKLKTADAWTQAEKMAITSYSLSATNKLLTQTFDALYSYDLKVRLTDYEETYKVAFKQAQKDFQNAEKQVAALEEEAVKALTGESQLDLGVVNSMLMKHRAKLETSQKAMEEAQTRMEAEKANAKETKAQIDELLSWAECFEKADIGTKHLMRCSRNTMPCLPGGYF